MNKFLKLLLLVLFLVAILFGFYLYKLHALAVEGNALTEQRCLKVNPPLVNYKNSFLKFSDFLKNPKKYNKEEIKGFFDGYISGMRKYIAEENKWLEIQNKFITRWDFLLFEPSYIKQAGDYQWKMYEAYRDDAKYLLEIVDKGETNNAIDAKQKEAKQRRDKYSKLYFDFVDKTLKINDWRKIVGNVPLPKGCNENNLTIPNTSGAL